MLRVPILTYHANNIDGMDYHNNDHVALAADLQLIAQMGLRIITMDQLIDWRLGHEPDSTVKNAVVLTCDDGTDFDFYDLDHPDYGPQTSFFNLLKTHQKQTGQSANMTNFVIVSPEARIVLDEKCLVGKGWWRDDWWQEAHHSGLMFIASHSWDHNHGVLDNQNVNDDSFRHINDKHQCDQQISQAQDYLHSKIGNGYQSKYFAYPYGNFSEYLRFEYLPMFASKLNLKAAFTTIPQHVNQFSKIWAIPRYVCNNDWKNTSQLKRILSKI
jgi:peptidoglycan/xylan/chitin deacetylase (PgdA/CDA1 family)